MSGSIKKITTAFGILVLLLSFSLNKVEAKPNRGVSLQVFYDELSYYGDWVNNPDYGYVWRPNVGRDFKPYYTNGHWVMTEYGNTWVSNYEWGWAPFHYGRWFYDDYDGWIWTPDTEWGPAWVTWRSGGGYYGWAPLAPRINININVGRRYYVPDNYWVFIPQRCIYYPSYSRYWEPRRNVYIVHNTTIINNIYTNRNVRYYTGPRADDIRRATRQDVPIYRTADNTRPGAVKVDKGTVNIYRPDVTRDDKDAAPRSIANNSPRPSRADGNTTPNYRNGDGNNTSRPNMDNVGNSSGNSSRPETINRPERSSDNTITRPDASSNNNRSDDPSSTQPTNNERGTRPEAARSNSARAETPSRAETPTRTERQEPSRSSQPSRSEPSNGNSNSRPSRVERSEPAQSQPRSVDRSSSRPSEGGNTSSRPTREN